ncbi:uncharacterized protein AKAME5_001243900 [Lates japonicus]|uniref:Uncharacterized protein n=1 Tax=Lates japonicus TaxID=270547 RepID=A0AAD3MSF5_LATJO|nr:uncharacterized protein AKAME5_001243900 [Lates japonicus]
MGRRKKPRGRKWGEEDEKGRKPSAFKKGSRAVRPPSPSTKTSRHPSSATQPSVAWPLGGRPPTCSGQSAGSAVGRKQAQWGSSHSQQSLFSRQPLVAQSRTTRQSQSQHPYSKPQAFLHTHSNTSRSSILIPRTRWHQCRKRTGRQKEGSIYSLTFSRLYNLKGLKDKMSKLPAQSKRGSTSSPGQGHKSTS